MYFFFPETNGRHLEEVDAIFLESKSIFDTVSVAAKLPKGNLQVARQIIEKSEANDGGHGSITEVEEGRNGDAPVSSAEV